MTQRSAPRRRRTVLTARGIYWRRRAVVLGVVAAFVTAVIILAGAGGGTEKSQAMPTPSPALASQKTPSPSPKPKPVAPVPTGPCDPAKIRITPMITGGVSGSRALIDLTLSTTEPACTFTVKGSSIALKVAADTHTVWSSQDCPSVVPTGSILLRSEIPIGTAMTWGGQESRGTCSAGDFVGPGTYRVIAAALGGQPTATEFTLDKPKPKPQPTPRAKPTHSASASPKR